MKGNYRIKETPEGYKVQVRKLWWVTIKTYPSDERLFAEELMDYLYEA